MEAKKLIKIDRNGSKHYEGLVECDRCQGRGWYAIGVHNNQLVPSHVDNAVCWKCHGKGKVRGKWIERTPEYQAKLDAKREAKRAKELAECEAKNKEREAEEARKQAEEEAKRIAEEERIKAERAISQFVGEEGEKLMLTVTYIGSPYFKRKSFGGYGEEECYIHNFKDADGNKLIWVTTKGLRLEEGAQVTLKGTVKGHREYKEEKQTTLTRCKVLGYTVSKE